MGPATLVICGVRGTMRASECAMTPSSERDPNCANFWHRNFHADEAVLRTDAPLDPTALAARGAGRPLRAGPPRRRGAREPERGVPGAEPVRPRPDAGRRRSRGLRDARDLPLPRRQVLRARAGAALRVTRAGAVPPVVDLLGRQRRTGGR